MRGKANRNQTLRKTEVFLLKVIQKKKKAFKSVSVHYLLVVYLFLVIPIDEMIHNVFSKEKSDMENGCPQDIERTKHQHE